MDARSSMWTGQGNDEIKITSARMARVNGDVGSGATADLLETLQTSLQSFLPATSSLHEAAILAAKHILDPLAQDISKAQDDRRKENRRKRKRGQQPAPQQELQIREVYTDGIGANQVWEQARRVMDAAAGEIERDLEQIRLQQYDGQSLLDNTKLNGDGSVKMVHFDDEGFEVGSDDSQADDSGTEDLMDSDDGIFEGAEGVDDVVAFEDIKVDQETNSLSGVDERAETFAPDPNNLNDGFFSIDDFNKQSQFLEQQDARGEDDNPSDQEEIDWDADPLSAPLPKAVNKAADDHDLEESEADGDGPTFGDPDAPSEDELDEDANLDDNMPGLGNTNDIQYAAFFEPPLKKPSKSKRMRALPKTQPIPTPLAENAEDVENDIQRAMADVRRDLLDSDGEASDEEASGFEDDELQKDKNLSTHEKQKAVIAAEIRKLEAAAVAKRDWTLSGEARAADRPVNSLIEEDLEFERAGKPVPVITAEVSEGIEALIKRRIVAREFDEVVRRRAEVLGPANETRRGRAELNDSQSKQGLAEIYEQEHLARSDPNYESTLDKKTRKAHTEIDRLWKEVRGQLDVLSNLHFKPKRAEVEIKSVEDKPTIRMEDARPGGASGEESMLAPQEIFRAGAKEDNVVVRKSGVSASKEEMSREEKLRHRRRQKERQKKAGRNEPVKQLGRDENPAKKGKKVEKNDILSDLRKGNVKVIGKKGQLEDLGKKARRGSGAQDSSAALKL